MSATTISGEMFSITVDGPRAEIRIWRRPDIDSETGLLATSNCPKVHSEVFIAGTQPIEACRLHGGGRTQIAGWEPTAPQSDKTSIASVEAVRAPARPPLRSIPIEPSAPSSPDPVKKSRGFFGRLRDIFR